LQGSILITGHRPYVVIIDALKKISSELQKVRVAQSKEEYAAHWTNILPRELEEGMNQQ
jgi:hypothetical protein